MSADDARFARDKDTFKLPEGDYDYIVVPPRVRSRRCTSCGAPLDFTEEVYCSYCKGLMDG